MRERGPNDPRDERREGDPRDPRREGDPRDPRGPWNEQEDARGELFEGLAAPGSVLFGLVCGLIYTLLVFYEETIVETPHPSLIIARTGLALMFVSAGLMGIYYFAVSSRDRRTVPWLAEQNKLFFFLWFLMGLTFAVRVISRDPAPEQTWAVVVMYFLIGSIAGTVWMFGLTLAMGVKSNIGSREVVRFPVWLTEEAVWLWRKIRGEEDRRGGG